MKRMTGIIMMIAGVILLASGFVLYRNSNTKEIVVETNSVQSESEPIVKSTEDESKQKGNDFEAFVVKKFDLKYFTIKEWAGDKYVDGVYAESTLNPDLIVEFKERKKNLPFAVECKFRQDYSKNGSIKFSYAEQFARYKDFEKNKNMPVFIVVGIGNTAKSPAELFVVPLKKIKSIYLNKEFLSKYSKDPKSKFFYNFRTKTLE